MRFPSNGMGGRVAVLLGLCAALVACSEQVHPSIRVSDEVEAQVRSVVMTQMPAGYEIGLVYRVPNREPAQVIAQTFSGRKGMMMGADYNLHFDSQAGVWVVDSVERWME